MDTTSLRWAGVLGEFSFAPDLVRFRGGVVRYAEEPGPAIGTALCDRLFGGGSLSADIVFPEVTAKSACDLVLYYNPLSRSFVSAGINNELTYGIRSFDSRWTAYSAAGSPNMLRAQQSYHLECIVQGSIATLAVDGVNVATAVLPFTLPVGQVGIWCRGEKDIEVRNFSVIARRPQAFVIMQFTSPYNELYSEVVQPLCAEFGVDAVRADDTHGPGLIIADVTRQIDEARVVIAEITPANPNVYYEVGYAHARGRPTILIAERRVERLPFDVSGFRTLFYDNSIDGKRKVEEALRRHLKAVLAPSTGVSAGGAAVLPVATGLLVPA
jgi:hypothetical protein